jgi:hypothetical protein
MAIRENIYYWKKSLESPEQAADPFYSFDKLIVTDSELIKKVERLRELIITYCVLSEKTVDAASEILNAIYDLIVSTDKIQYTEFVAFWKTLDISYSVFGKLLNQKAILKELLQKYCERRRELYDKMGYTNITVQALYDVGSSRKKGVSGIDKIIDMIQKNMRNVPHAKDINTLMEFSTAYFSPDKGDKHLFRLFCKKIGIKYSFGKDHQDKEPDIVLKINDKFFIIEAKHIKESGGAQDKQIVELIEFIRYSEELENVHYVSFMDGVYFNNFSWAKEGDETKVNKQKKAIEEHLTNNPKNFFVNTSGLLSLFEDLKN